MVHLVKKIFNKKVYLYVQRSKYDKKTKKRSTEHVMYLGLESSISKKKIKEILLSLNKDKQHLSDAVNVAPQEGSN